MNCLRLVAREQLSATAVGQVLTRMSVVLEAVKLALRGMNAPQLPIHPQFVWLDSIGTSASCITIFDVKNPLLMFLFLVKEIVIIAWLLKFSVDLVRPLVRIVRWAHIKPTLVVEHVRSARLEPSAPTLSIPPLLAMAVNIGNAWCSSSAQLLFQFLYSQVYLRPLTTVELTCN